MKKLILLMVILFLPFVIAQAEECFKQGDVIDFKQVIRVNGAPSNNIKANITITDPDDLLLVGFDPMTYDSLNKTFNYTFSQTQKVGTYERCVTATDGQLNDTVCFDFDITPSGFCRIREGESMAMVGGSALMVLISLLFFVMFLKVNNVTTKVAFLSGAVIVLFMAVLFITITLQQNLAGFDKIIDGYETFVFVIQMLMIIALVAFSIFGILMIGFYFVKAYRKRRGIDD